MRRILVTGGAGFIGSHYVRTMLDGGYPGWEDAHITVLDKLTYAGNLANLPAGHPRLSFAHGDVCDPDLVGRLVRGQDAVVHFAAESHVDRSLAEPHEFVRTNVLGTHNLLDRCARADVERIVYVSTDEVYGSIETGLWTEDTPLRPNSPYSASKASGDMLARAYFRSHGLPVVTTHCSNNYGPYQYAEKVIPLFVTNLLLGRRVPLYGDGLHTREWLHVDDHCRGVQLALEKGRAGEVYNIGGGVELTNLELTTRILELCGAGWDRVRRVADRPGHDRRYALDHGKARRELGFEPRVPFDDGLAAVVRWYAGNRWWWEPARRQAAAVPRPGPARAAPRARPAAVIGSAGFIGSRLAAELADGQVPVAGFTRERPFLDGAGALAEPLREAGTVFYLASGITPQLAERHPERVAADHELFGRLLDGLAGLDRPPLVVLASSGGTVYDPAAAPPYREDGPTRGTAAYARAKLAMEERLLVEQARVPGIALRLSNVYGPGQPARPGSGFGVIAHWLRAHREGLPVPLYADPATVRDFVYIDDAVEAMTAVHAADRARSPLPRILNIGSGTPTSLGELLELMGTVLGCPVAVDRRHPGRGFDRGRAVLDVRRAAGVLGWRARTPLADGLARTWLALDEQAIGDGA